MSKEVFSTDPSLPFSEVVISNGTAYVAGQIGFGSDGNLVGEGIEEQTRATLDNLKLALEKVELSLENVIRTGCYLVNKKDLATFNKIYSEYFTHDRPARSTIFVAGLPVDGSIVEIDAIATTGKI